MTSIKRFLFLLTILAASFAWAGAVPEYNRSVRALGMGGAFAAIATGSDMLYYNPAALKYNSELRIELANVNFGINGLSIYDTVSGLTDLTDTSQLNQIMGSRVWIGAYGRLSLIAPYFGIGVGTEYEADMYFRNPAFPEVETYFRNDSDARMSYAFSLGDKGAIGVTFKRIARWGGDTQTLSISQVSNPTQLSNIGDNFANKGTGYGADLAAMYKWDGLVSSSVAAVWHDVGCTRFVKTSGNDNPSRVQDNVVLSYGLGMDLPGFDWTAAVDYRHLGTTGIDSSKKIHVGTEFSLPFIDLRVGSSQGYMSYGVGLDMLLMRFDAVMYKEEIGTYSGQNSDDRVLLSLTLDLGFDANFNFIDNKTGKKLKLKQRR